MSISILMYCTSTLNYWMWPGEWSPIIGERGAKTKQTQLHRTWRMAGDKSYRHHARKSYWSMWGSGAYWNLIRSRTLIRSLIRSCQIIMNAPRDVDTLFGGACFFKTLDGDHGMRAACNVQESLYPGKDQRTRSLSTCA